MQKAQGKLKHLGLMVLMVLLVSCTVHSGQESSLQTALVRESDFSPDWHWTARADRVESELDTGTEGVSQVLSGLYSSKQHYVKIMHLILRHDRPVSCDLIGLGDDSSFPEGEDFSIETVTVGRCVKSKCVRGLGSKSPSTMVCQVTVGYEYVTSGLTIYGPGNMSDQDIETIINEALTGTDARIERIDNSPE